MPLQNDEDQVTKAHKKARINGKSGEETLADRVLSLPIAQFQLLAETASTITAILEPHPDGSLHLPVPAEMRRGKVKVIATLIPVPGNTKEEPGLGVKTLNSLRRIATRGGIKNIAEAHVADSWGGAKLPTYTDTRSTENATQTELVFAA